jgi:hypothetical protein
MFIKHLLTRLFFNIKFGHGYINGGDSQTNDVEIRWEGMFKSRISLTCQHFSQTHKMLALILFGRVCFSYYLAEYFYHSACNLSVKISLDKLFKSTQIPYNERAFGIYVSVIYENDEAFTG